CSRGNHPGENESGIWHARNRPTRTRPHGAQEGQGGLRMGFLDRFRHADHGTETGPERPSVVQIDATSLSRVFSAPMWVRDLGLLAWFLVGVGILLVGTIVLPGLAST